MVGPWIFNFDMRIFCVSRVHILLPFPIWSRGGLSRAGIPAATVANVNGICFPDGDFVV